MVPVTLLQGSSGTSPLCSFKVKKSAGLTELKLAGKHCFYSSSFNTDVSDDLEILLTSPACCEWPMYSVALLDIGDLILYTGFQRFDLHVSLVKRPC